ncbi:VOC family protein [Natronobacterium gregoryi]|uniref:Glyoxalase n=2 Tax=Natronobacterium gregoryi TaxID=44930 RepID=L0AD23_NATGS|nr:VOC family protein [Natronobacterium gregoryi]AFZ71741.1 lactoylglutathione lyase-like lyase [Natronobacterium gregoryi SP2]ELY72872.1 glyoxalase/bleomycin resistance protein/dioxygenase [Natronobacterium gregoryi SP2]PLK21076.1 glyoxalase [Natronobacterium gregoryi SP2]SFI88862.1 Catechol 2,3-dioxygenase [Natronobacterium gregoryi]
MDHDHADPNRLGQLHHVELYVSDFETSVDFWGWWLTELGYERKDEWDGGRSWINGPTYVVIVQADDDTAAFDRRTPGLNHLAFHADSREQVDYLTECARARDDSRVLYEDQHPYAGGYYALYCESPKGLKLEAIAPDSSG